MSEIRMPTADDPAVLVCGDAFEALKAMPDASVDHVITDPPYAEKTHAGALGSKGARRLVAFDSIGEEVFVRLCDECTRVARRWVVMTCDWRHAAAAEAASPNVIRLGVWVKMDPAPQFSGDRPATGWEAVLMLHRPGRKRWNGGGLPAWWQNHIVKNNAVHPTEKPLALVRRWVDQFTDFGDTILDPFAGSGTTLVAAVQRGRLAIGFEKDPAHYATARRRIDEALGVGGLFENVAPAQPDLFAGG
jgi:site-specific DNA-methyltransferase (adenine-specific)